MRNRLLLFCLIFLAAAGIVSATCPDASGVWTVSTPTTQSTSVANCTLINVTNGTTLTLAANITVNTTVFIIENGTVTHSSMSRINITAVNLTVTATGMMNASILGYGAAAGPGAGTLRSGGSYASESGASSTNSVGNAKTTTIYGNATHPTDYGSGGGSGDSAGGGGGGIIILNVTGVLHNDGTIVNMGGPVVSNNAGPGGGGSGGSVFIITNTFEGSGSINASGSRGGSDADDDGGGGGSGGRIAIHYAAWAYTGAIVAYGGGADADTGTEGGGAGVIYLLDTSSGQDVLSIDAGNNDPTITNLTSSTTKSTYSHLNLTNATLFGIDLTITNTTTINPGATSVNSIITGPHTLTVRAGGNLTFESNTNTDQYRLNITAGALIVESGAFIDGSGRGYSTDNGPGFGYNVSGASHGGMGGLGTINSVRYTNNVQVPYGNTTHPTAPGSGGATQSASGGAGGGAIILNVTGNLTIAGTIATDGIRGTQSATVPGSAGSGGSILIFAENLTGAGTITARGGRAASDFESTADDDDSGAGGGGRVAIHYRRNGYTGTITAAGGDLDDLAYAGGAGTIYLNDLLSGEDTLLVSNAGANNTAITNLTNTTTKPSFTNINLTNTTVYGRDLAPTRFRTSGTNVTLYANVNCSGEGNMESGITVQLRGDYSCGSTDTGNGSRIISVALFGGGNVAVGDRTNLTTSTADIDNITTGTNTTWTSTGTILAFNVTIGSGGIWTTNGTMITNDITTGTGSRWTQNNTVTAGDLIIGANANLTISQYIIARNVTFLSGSLITHSTDALSQLSAVNITATNINISSGSRINATARGYTGGGDSSAGNGPGGGRAGSGTTGASGGTHAGYGGIAQSNTLQTINVYGNTTHPTQHGSGGGGGTGSASGGSGGGTIILNATSSIIVDGSITANGGPAVGTADGSGGGSGGSILIVAASISGSANITAAGSAGTDATEDGGGGSGGRIAFHYLTNSFNGIINATGGDSINGEDGGPGTIYHNDLTLGKDTLTITNGMADSAQETNLTSNTTKSTFNHLSIANATIHGITLTITDTLTTNPGTVYLNNPIIGTSNITVKNASALTHTDGDTTTPYSVNLTSATITVENGGSILVSGRGYTGGGVTTVGNGPGGGRAGSGTTGASGGTHAGYGGIAQSNTLQTINVYGNTTHPTQHGSGGGGGSAAAGGDGGGVVVLNATGTVNISGAVIANGINGTDTADGSGGGSGGSISILAGAIIGDGVMSVMGGNGSNAAEDGGGGGGGRIALHYATNAFNGLITAAGGDSINGEDGGPGTIYHNDLTRGQDTLVITNGLASPLQELNLTANTTKPSFNYLNITNSTIHGMVIYVTNTTRISQGTVYLNAPIAGAGNITIENGGSLQHTDATTGANWTINLTGTNLVVEPGAAINVTARGYAGGAAATAGSGPGAGSSGSNQGGGGASHAGNGGSGNSAVNANTVPYGNATHPTTHGSGGGGATSTGGAGGGVIIINLTGTLNNSGGIDATGENGTSGSTNGGGGGSGGSIWITANRIVGDGPIVAYGGKGGDSTNRDGGGGGSGRISMHYAVNSITGAVYAGGRTATGSAGAGGAGTIYLRDTASGEDALVILGNTAASTTGDTNLTAETTKSSFTHLNLTNATTYGIALLITETVTVNSGTFYLNNPIIGASDITVKNGATLSHSPLSTDFAFPLNITAANLTIETGGAINTTANGFDGGAAGAAGNGPGNGSSGSNQGGGGAAHGGMGGSGNSGTNLGTLNYSDVVLPVLPGSGGGGGSSTGGAGGGSIIINLTGTLNNTGGIQANGENGTSGVVNGGGGGSGGGILISANTIIGTGMITANGGKGGDGSNRDGGSAAGGRISLSFRTMTLTGAISPAAGTVTGNGAAGNEGTVFLCQSSTGMGCPGSINSIALTTLYLRNGTVNITRNLTSDWSDTRLVWNETANQPNTIGEYILSGLTYPNYKVRHNATFNDSVLNSLGTLGKFQANISGMMQISVLAPNNTAPFNPNSTLNGSLHAAQVYPNEDLLCYTNASDSDDFNVTAYWTMYNGTVHYSNGSRSIVTNGTLHLLVNVSATVTNPLESWTCGVVIGDSYANLSQVNHTRTLELTAAPTVTSVSISPSPAYTADILLGWCNATDVDNDTLTYHYTWFLNGTLNSSGHATNGGVNYTQGLLVNIANISAASTTKHDNWTLQCMASQGIVNSTRYNGSIEIQNTVPTGSAVTMNSSRGANTTTQDLTAYASASDADSDLLYFAYDWRRNGTSIALLNMNFDVNDSLGNGTVRDYSTHANHGALGPGSARPNWNFTGGHNGTGSYWFNGSSYINISASSAFDIQNLTISAWVYSTSYAQNMFIFEKGDVNTQYSLFFEASGSVITFRTYNSGASQNDLDLAHGLTDGVWHHVAATYNGTHKAIYLDGVRASSAAYTQTLRTGLGTGERIGAYGGAAPSYFFIGSIDNLGVYNRSLSPDEILALARNQTHTKQHTETETGENWTVCATPDDHDSNATTVCTSGLLITDNNAPVLSTLIVNSSFGRNTTQENLTAYPTSADTDNDTVRHAFDWRLNGTSIARLNMNFDAPDTGGTYKTRDYSTYSNNGTVVGAMFREGEGVAGSGAYFFDGIDDYINLTDDTDLELSVPFSVSAWFRIHQLPSTDESYIIVGKWGATGNLREWILYVDQTTNKVTFMKSPTGTSTTHAIYAGNVLSSSDLYTWQHVTVTVNGSGYAVMYINGAQSNTTTFASTTIAATTTQAMIGAAHSSTTTPDLFMHGLIDEVQIWNRTLTAQQALALYSNRTDLIANQEISAGQNWTACVTPTDQWSQGATMCSEGIQISTAVPIMNSSRITPTPTAYLTDNITGYCNATSPAGSPIAYNYTWYKTNATDTNVIIYQGVGFKGGSIDASYQHVCGIRASDSRVLCWGLNGNGQIGNGSTTSPATNPTLINDTSAYKQVSVGDAHTCGIRASDSRVLCWGLNTGGRLGNGSSGSGNGLNPRLINDTSAYANISAGGENTCGIRANDSRILCWGDNSNGELGDATNINRNTTTLINDTAAYKQVSVGASHTCAIRANDSRVLCWGSNDFSQLGNGSNTGSSNKPVLLRNTSAFSQVSAGVFHTCGIRSNDSRVLCWGIAQSGEIGNGSSGGGLEVANATFTSDTAAYLRIASGDSVSCGIRANDSRVLCWGEDGLGGNGDGSAGADNLVPTLTSDTSAYADITMGYQGGCGVRANDTRVLCWGYNGNGQVGDGGIVTPKANPTLTTSTSSFYIGFPTDIEGQVSILNNSLIRSGDNITLGCIPYDGTYGAGLNSSVTTIIDSCFVPALNSNWLVYASENCTKTLTSINLGSGNLTVSGARGPGRLHLNGTNVTANNVNVLGYGNLTQIVLENSANVVIT